MFFSRLIFPDYFGELNAVLKTVEPSLWRCNSSTWLQTTADYRAKLRNNILVKSITLYVSPTTRFAWQLTGTLAPLTLFNKETSWRYDRHKVRVVSGGGGGGLEQVGIVQVSSKHVFLFPHSTTLICLRSVDVDAHQSGRTDAWCLGRFLFALCAVQLPFISVYPA